MPPAENWNANGVVVVGFLRLSKEYAAEGETPGVHFEVVELVNE